MHLLKSGEHNPKGSRGSTIIVLHFTACTDSDDELVPGDVLIRCLSFPAEYFP